MLYWPSVLPVRMRARLHPCFLDLKQRVDRLVHCLRQPNIFCDPKNFVGTRRVSRRQRTRQRRRVLQRWQAILELRILLRDKLHNIRPQAWLRGCDEEALVAYVGAGGKLGELEREQVRARGIPDVAVVRRNLRWQRAPGIACDKLVEKNVRAKRRQPLAWRDEVWTVQEGRVDYEEQRPFACGQWEVWRETTYW